MMQINAHPASQRRALRAATHIDAYYSLLYQGLENPPKLNPLAIIRWVRRMDEQKEARAKWAREHAEQTDRARLTSPLPWQGMRSSVSSPGSEGLRPLASPRLPGGGVPPPRSVASAASKEVCIAPGWHYTLDDIQAYNECGGRIDFFIPPVLDEPEPEASEPAEPAERPLSAAMSERSDANMSQPSIVLSAGRERELAMAVPRITSPSTPSLGQSGENGEDGSLSAGGISRTTSIDNGQRPIRQNRVPRHRSYQSTSGIPQPRPLQTLRALGTGVRRNLAAAVHSPGTDYDDERRGSTGALPWSTMPSAADSPHGQTPHSRSTLPWNPLSSANDATTPQHHVSAHSLRDRGLLGLRSRGDGVATSDEDHPHHLRRLLVKRPAAAFDRLSRRVIPGDHDGRAGTVSRAAELRNLEQALARERTLREAQAKKAKRTEQRTELELQAEERLREVEDEVYAERENRLHEAQQRLERAEAEGEQMDAAISHFLIQLDQVRSVFRTAADVDVKFENLDALGRPERRDTDDEEADDLGPLRDGGEYSDRSKWVAPRGKPRRQTPLSTSPNLPSFAHGLSAWPKRSTLDPTLGVALDPFRCVELSCEKARATVRDMDDKRAAATRQMQDMVGGVNALIAQKDAVRAWAKAANERIVALKATKANKAGKVHGGLFATLWQGPGIDIATDMFVRACLSVFSYGIRVGRVISWVRGRGWLAWAMLGGVLSMLVVFYLFGAEGMGEPAPVAA